MGCGSWTERSPGESSWASWVACWASRTITAVYPHGVPGGSCTVRRRHPRRGAIADGLGIVVVPVVILLGVLAGIGIIVRCFRAEGLERQQAAMACGPNQHGLLLFPFAVTQTLPD